MATARSQKRRRFRQHETARPRQGNHRRQRGLGVLRLHGQDHRLGRHAAALGMTPLLAMRRIILPQAIRVVIPAFGNCLIGPFKEASLCSVITVQEVMFRAEMSAARNYQYFTLNTIIAAMYLAVSFPAATLLNTLERRGAHGRWGGRAKRRSGFPQRRPSSDGGPSEDFRHCCVRRWTGPAGSGAHSLSY
jgi:hypothetical protein